MGTADQVDEWHRLQASYLGMTDEELEGLAEESYQLTDLAKQALQSEITRRGVSVRLREAPTQQGLNPNPSEFDPSELDLVVAQRVWDSAEAKQVKKILDDAGIPSFLGPDNLHDFADFSAGFEGGVDIKVRDIDNQRALRALSQLSTPDPEDNTKYLPVCPKCQSPEIVFENLQGQEESRSSFDAKFNWRCDGCGYQWTDDGIEKELG
jgi:DNA-directed RNA polymerase subunit M/transcription elongation factor TFIIS